MLKPLSQPTVLLSYLDLHIPTDTLHTPIYTHLTVIKNENTLVHVFILTDRTSEVSVYTDLMKAAVFRLKKPIFLLAFRVTLSVLMCLTCGNKATD